MKLRTILPITTLLWASTLNAQSAIDNVVVETYYISDANDQTDTIGNVGGLPAGSRTYRVYLDLCDSCALRALYGDTNHVFSITSTGLFFNHNDRGRTYGHEINNGALDEGTTALDSWLSMGAASNAKLGILKVDDPDGSIVGGANNDGGSALVAGGLLTAQDPDAGVPLTTSDGLVPLNGGTATPVNFNRLGDDPDAAFGDSTLTNGFTSNQFRIGCGSPGVKGPTAANRILVAQVTTTGELNFLLNVEIQRADGSVERYVATDSVLLSGETANGLLQYPPQCGCTDPDFLEYDPTAGCDDGSCQTAIVFGCTDPLACNYDPGANFNIPLLCCYGPDSCNGLDITVICPDVSVDEVDVSEQLVIRPNPSSGPLYIERPGGTAFLSTMHVFDVLGRATSVKMGPVMLGAAPVELDLGSLPAGTYLLEVRSGSRRSVHRIVRTAW